MKRVRSPCHVCLLSLRMGPLNFPTGCVSSPWRWGYPVHDSRKQLVGNDLQNNVKREIDAPAAIQHAPCALALRRSVHSTKVISFVLLSNLFVLRFSFFCSFPLFSEKCFSKFLSFVFPFFIFFFFVLFFQSSEQTPKLEKSSRISYCGMPSFLVNKIFGPRWTRRLGVARLRVTPLSLFFIFLYFKCSFFLVLGKLCSSFSFSCISFIYVSFAGIGTCQTLPVDVSSVVGASWRCGVLTTQGRKAGIGWNHILGTEHDSAFQSGVEAARLLKRSLLRSACDLRGV